MAEKTTKKAVAKKVVKKAVVKKVAKKAVSEPKETEPLPIQKEIPEAKELSKETKNSSISEEKGILLLRMFIKDERTGKILTRLKRKVFFPTDPNIEPGWYIATVIEAKDNYGVMDTIALDKVPEHLWSHRYIKGIYIERDHFNNTLLIYPAIPRSSLEEQRSTCIYKVMLPKPEYKSGATIGEILKSKI